MDVLERMKKVQSSLENAKLPFAEYIKDQSIPLAERWEVFCLAPSEMKTHENYGPDFQSLPDDFIMYEGPIHMDRGNTMKTTTMVSDIEEALSDIANDDYFGADWHLECFSQVNLDEVKEEILQKNLGSFDYDW